MMSFLRPRRGHYLLLLGLNVGCGSSHPAGPTDAAGGGGGMSQAGAGKGGTSGTSGTTSAPNVDARNYTLLGSVQMPAAQCDLQFSGADHILQADDGTLYAVSINAAIEVEPGAAPKSLFLFSQSSTGLSGHCPTSLVLASDGNLYGTTYNGANNGTVFELTFAGDETVVYSFAPSATGDTTGLPTSLLQGTDGSFYGTTALAGIVGTGVGGEIFQMTKDGVVTALTTLETMDGVEPRALLQASDGNLYGVSWGGGTNGAGTVFRVALSGDPATSGTAESLYSFSPMDNTGPTPLALVEGSDHDLYGITEGGGATNDGVLFRVTPSGDFSSVYEFDKANHLYGPAALVAGGDGKLYGIAHTDGDVGAVFEADEDGTVTTIHRAGSNEGFPTSLVVGTDGNLYGTAYFFDPENTAVVTSQIFELD
ncbi:MAG TPA: choice-of-anchor tandem repeat GloVer-containing protein [Polyangiaceae bacterium]|nr:choice-of-anchor tandem repeat GloVer-containing protein [Polyangiaceae bacterium]